ncbi:MAG: hypothetical protein LAT67_15060 [Balneolales bacterium]|nr:hypothetical protein [Balneolales bacterium]
MKNISRIDQNEKNTFGWFVRIRRDGRQVSKFFSDGKFDGKDKALKAAIEFRDKHIQEWENYAKNHDRPMHVGTKSNIGHNGISYTQKRKKRNDKEYIEHVFSVCYSPVKGVNKNKTFYIPKAKTKAEFKKNYQAKLQEAIEFRDQMMHKIYGLRYVNFKLRQKKLESIKERNKRSGGDDIDAPMAAE